MCSTDWNSGERERERETRKKKRKKRKKRKETRARERKRLEKNVGGGHRSSKGMWTGGRGAPVVGGREMRQEGKREEKDWRSGGARHGPWTSVEVGGDRASEEKKKKKKKKKNLSG